MNKGVFKRLALLLVLCSIFLAGLAQLGKLPPFKMVKADGAIFRAQQLPVGKPIVIIYFSPECDHCTAMMKELVTRTADLKTASVAFVTFLSVDAVKSFTSQYGLSSQPNFYVGTEGNSSFLRNYYKITEMPFMALYTKEGNNVASFAGDNALKKILTELKKLK